MEWEADYISDERRKEIQEFLDKGLPEELQFSVFCD